MVLFVQRLVLGDIDEDGQLNDEDDDQYLHVQMWISGRSEMV